MGYLSGYDVKRKSALDLIRFMGGFLSRYYGRTKITRSDANNILHFISEVTSIPYASLVDLIIEKRTKYESTFVFEQYNRNHGVGASKIEFDWPQGA